MEQMAGILVEKKQLELEGKGIVGAELQQQLEDYRTMLRRSMDEGEKKPILLSAIRGPVSVNPVAVFDGLLGFGVFEINSPQGRAASVNAGELLFPNSRWSVVPLLVLAVGGFVLIGRMAAQHDRLG